MLCVLCNKVCSHTDQVYYEVRGFETYRKQGGTNQLKRRTRTGRVAHKLCVETKAAPGQETLI